MANLFDKMAFDIKPEDILRDMRKRLRDDAKQCKIVLLRYTKALDNDNVIKCN